jgi:hypothetical protein
VGVGIGVKVGIMVASWASPQRGSKRASAAVIRAIRGRMKVSLFKRVSCLWLWRSIRRD